MKLPAMPVNKTDIMDHWKNFSKGFIKENPVFVLLLGMCPTLGVTSSAVNGLGMGLATTFVLLMSNIVVSLVKNLIPDKVVFPHLLLGTTFVTVVNFHGAYVPALYKSLGLFFHYSCKLYCVGKSGSICFKK